MNQRANVDFNMDFYVNEEKRTVVAKINIIEKVGPFKIIGESYLGKAKCSPEDIFDAEKGKSIAELRALLKYYKNLFKEGKGFIEEEELAIKFKTKMLKEVKKDWKATGKLITLREKQLKKIVGRP